MKSNADEILRRLEEAAAKQEAERAKVSHDIEVSIERSDAELGAAKDAMRPVFRAAVEKAAPILDAFLESPEWERLLTALGRLQCVSRLEEVTLPPLFLSHDPYRKPGATRALFEGEALSVSPYTGGVFHWTIGKRLVLTRKSHRMQPPQIVFHTDSTLRALIPWFEDTSIGLGAPQVALRLCELVCEGRLLALLAERNETA